MTVQYAVGAYRGRICENTHQASAVLYSQTGDVTELFPNSKNRIVFLRSAAKPFQAFPLLAHPEAAALSQQEWAIIAASHAATAEQQALVLQVLGRAGLTPEALQCGAEMPMDPDAYKQALCSNKEPKRLFHNCSGKHSGFLLACRLYGWPVETYLDPDHPLQQLILFKLQTLSDAPLLETAIDGCGAPVVAMPLANAARLFSTLTQPETGLSTVTDAMRHFPEIVGDSRRIDSQLMRQTNGRILAKVGADGFVGLANFETSQGLVLKVHDGVNPIRDRLVIPLLARLNWLTPQEAETLQAQSAFSPWRLNSQGKRIGHFKFDLEAL